MTTEILADLRRLGQSYYFTADTSDIEVFDSAAKMRAHMVVNASLANIHLYTVHYGTKSTNSMYNNQHGNNNYRNQIDSH